MWMVDLRLWLEPFQRVLEAIYMLLLFPSPIPRLETNSLPVSAVTKITCPCTFLTIFLGGLLYSAPKSRLFPLSHLCPSRSEKSSTVSPTFKTFFLYLAEKILFFTGRIQFV